jgi:hypothetical membrane protein
MSLLGGVPGLRGLIFNIGVCTTSVMVIVFGVLLCRQLPPQSSASIAMGLFLVGGLGLLGAGLFHCNEGCRNVLVAPDLIGRVHAIASFIAGMATGLALVFVWLAVRNHAKFETLVGPTLAAALLANFSGILFWISFLTGGSLSAVEGVFQRTGILTTLFWMFYVAVRIWARRPILPAQGPDPG